MSKLQTFQSFYSLHKPPHPYWFPLLSSYAFCGQIFENIFFFLDLLVQKLFFDKNHWFQLLSNNNNWIISLLLISVTLHSLSASLSTIPSCLLLAKKLWFLMKTLLLLLAKSPYARKICFLVCFLSFFRVFLFCFCCLVYWDHYNKYAGYDSLKPRKMYWPSHPKQRIYEVSLLGVRKPCSLLHKFLRSVCFSLHVSC